MKNNLYYDIRDLKVFSSLSKGIKDNRVWSIGDNWDGNSISIIDNKTKEKLFTIDCDIHTATYICMLNNRLLDLISEVEEKYDVKVD